MRLRTGLPSLARVLGQRGFRTAAFVGNWTLRDAISGLGEHFHTYRQIASRKRWLVLKSEATGDDLTAAALDWLARLRQDSPERPFLLWVHYVEPHAPYRTQTRFTRALGYGGRRDLAPGERYDTEVAFADHAIGELLAGVAQARARRGHPGRRSPATTARASASTATGVTAVTSTRTTCACRWASPGKASCSRR